MVSIRFCYLGKNVCSGHAQRTPYNPEKHMTPEDMLIWEDDEIGRCFLGDIDASLEQELKEYVRVHKPEVEDALKFVMHPVEENDLKIFKTSVLDDRNVTRRTRERRERLDMSNVTHKKLRIAIPGN